MLKILREEEIGINVNSSKVGGREYSKLIKYYLNSGDRQNGILKNNTYVNVAIKYGIQKDGF